MEPMFDPELCAVPICAGTPHDLYSVLVVRCPHTGGTTVYVKAYDDQVTRVEERTLPFGPFDTTQDVIEGLTMWLGRAMRTEPAR